MKKIVAIVLSLVMVLGLATTAFAAEDAYDLYQADAQMTTDMKVGTTDYADMTITEVAAKTNKDGSGNVAYLVIADASTTLYAVKTTAPLTSSFAVCDADKTTVLFYVNVVAGATADYFAYDEVVKASTNFGKKCGQYDITATAGTDYFVAADGALYAAGDAGASGNYLLNGVVVSGTQAAATPVGHSFTANNFKYDAALQTNVPTSAVCTICLMNTTAIYATAKVPATYTPYALTNDNNYVVALGASAPAAGTTAETVESAQTFDAGIAMYVGMSVMAAAGSAVVLKKKD